MKKAIVLLLTVIFFSLGAAGCPPPKTHIRAAFDYEWYPETWSVNGQNVFYNPTLGKYNSSTQSVADAHIRALDYANVDVGIASWFGQGTHSEATRIQQLLSRTAALSSPLKWTIYYEPEGIGNPTVAQIKSDLTYINTKYASKSAYEKLGGKPVIFVYNADDSSCSVVDKWKQANASVGFYLNLKVFPGYTSCASQPDSWHQYSPSSATDDQGQFSYSISPGFWRADESVPRLARNLSRWQQNVASMVASSAKWQLITTFNEWGEGTATESANEWSSSSGYGSYLDALHNNGTTTSTSSSSSSSSSTSTTIGGSGVCNNSGIPILHQKVVVFSFENRTWSGVGGTQFQSMPYLNGLAKKCSTFANFTEPDTGQNSATQYVGTVTGSNTNTVRDDCSPSSSCNSQLDNIFRQVRNVGKTAINYVEGASQPCSSSGNAAKHIPDLYMWGSNDRSFCNTQTRPYSEFVPGSVPDFSFITPTLCNDGHDCGNSTVDNWAATNVQAVLNSAAYKAGQVTVFIWYDEDQPVPNMQIGLHALAGVKNTAVDYGSVLRAWEDLLGVPRLAHAANAVDMRSPANI